MSQERRRSRLYCFGVGLVLAACASSPEERAPSSEPLSTETTASKRASLPSPDTERVEVEPTAAAPDEPESSPEPFGAPGPWTEERTLASAAFDEPNAPSVIVHASPHFDPARPLRLVVFLHGWNGCARMLVSAGPSACKDGARPREGWDLAGRFDEAGSDALFVVPQLAFLARSGRPGRFGEPGGFRAFLTELLASLAPRIGPGRSLNDVENITLLAHSAGFESALAILARGQVEVRNVVLFDALYAGVEPFGRWALEEEGRKLVSLYTSGRTAAQSRRLARWSRARLDDAVAIDPDEPLASVVARARIVVARSPAPHGQVPARHLPELLTPLGLSSRR